MTRRSGNEDPEFGSDSFLDIIANIVGILIILIVIAGVKVARQPPPGAPMPIETPSAVSESITPESTTDTDPPPRVASLATPDQLHFLQEEAQRAASRSVELQQQLTRLEEESQVLVDAAAQTRQEASQLNVEIASWRQQVVDAESDQVRAAEETTDLQRQLKVLEEQVVTEKVRQDKLTQATTLAYGRQEFARADLQDIAAQTHKLQELITEQQATVPDAERLKHRLSPVARSDGHHELHFRLRSGRVSWVPLEPLLERLKRQVTNRVSLIRKFGQYEGVCGPVGGYIMRYGIERVVASPLGGLNGMSGGYRIAVSRWTVTPTDSLRAESIDEALRFGSRFRQVAEAAEPDATMTVWLYAGDFAHFRRLREFGHGLGLRVAARPLPDDAEITGSPGGSRSSAQ